MGFNENVRIFNGLMNAGDQIGAKAFLMALGREDAQDVMNEVMRQILTRQT